MVAGSPGAGKTRLARTLAGVRGLPYVEIDGLYHGPNWTPRPSFAAEVQAFAAQESWVTEWQYTSVRPKLLARATTVVWLDLPTWRVQAQLWRRTLTRWSTRQELWHGNREPGLRVLLSRNDESILWWGWTNRDRYRDLPALLAAIAAEHEIPDPHMDGLVVVHLRTHREVKQWLDAQIH